MTHQSQTQAEETAPPARTARYPSQKACVRPLHQSTGVCRNTPIGERRCM